MKLSEHPISNVEWLHSDLLVANNYNPNHVLAPEFRLLKSSLMKQGWIQPVLVTMVNDGDCVMYEIIDGFHRVTAVKTDKKIFALTDGRVPCCVMNLTDAERKMLTVRINRAKGSHQALKMHELVRSLHEEEGLTVDEIGEGIGANKHEVEMLLAESIFKKFDVANTPYSRAWMPKDRDEA